MAGCTSPANDSSVEPVQSGSIILVDDGDGGHTAVNVTAETGAVVGRVLTDSGFGLPGALVIVTGSGSSVTTNDSGWFEVGAITPGQRIVRAERQGYQAAERQVMVEAGKVRQVTITLVPAVGSEAGSRPHMHDYWAGQSEVTVIDADFPWDRPTQSAYHQYAGTANRMTTFIVQSNCAFGADSQFRSAGQSTFFFNDPAQLVWPGTTKISVTISWASNSYIGDAVGVLWRSPNMKGFGWSPPIRSGTPFTIDVTPQEADNAHQQFTLWEWHLCVRGKGEQTAAGYNAGRVFLGDYHVVMTLHGSAPTELDPPHPSFWANGSVVRVLEGYANITCPNVISPCIESAIVGRSAYLQYFQMRPHVLVPPGATALVITLNWTYSQTINNVPLGLAYSAANVPPSQKDDLKAYKIATAATAASRSKSYSLTVGGSEADSYYQQRSNWVFLWGQEGQEASATYTHSCVCEIRVRLSVDAHRTPTER